MVTTVHPYVQQVFGSIFFNQSILISLMSSYLSEVSCSMHLSISSCISVTFIVGTDLYSQKITNMYIKGKNLKYTPNISIRHLKGNFSNFDFPQIV